MTNKKFILVTGSFGFLAQNLIKKLLELNYNILGIDKKNNVSFCYDFSSYKIKKKLINISLDLNNEKKLYSLLSKYNIICCFHLAAITQVNESDKYPLNNFKTNIMTTIYLLEYFRQNSKKTIFIYSSSDKAYGKFNKLPYREDFPLNGIHPYDVSKSTSDKIVQTYNYHYNMKTAITRSVNIYGPCDLNFNRLIPETILSIVKNKKIILRSNGKYLRDYIYVDDVVEGYISLYKFMIKNKINLLNNTFNFGTNKPIKVIELVKIIINKNKKYKKSILIKDIANNEIINQYSTFSKSKKLLKWKPNFSLDTGIDLTIKWYTNYLLNKK